MENDSINNPSSPYSATQISPTRIISTTQQNITNPLQPTHACDSDSSDSSKSIASV